MKKNHELPESLSKDQQIQAAFDRQKSFNSKAHANAEIPDHIQFQVGAPVVVGNLNGFFISEVRGQYILLENTCIQPENGKTKTNQHEPFIVAHWLDVFPVATIQETRFTEITSFKVNYTSRSLRSLLNDAWLGGINDSPDYQRDYTWTLEDKQKLIDSIIKGREIGKFIFVEDHTCKTESLEVLDGKQRLNAIMDFIYNKFDYQGIFFHQLSGVDRHNFNDMVVQSAKLDANRFSRKELLEIFLNVNAAGVPQTEDHLQFVKALLQEENDQENNLRLQ